MNWWRPSLALACPRRAGRGAGAGAAAPGTGPSAEDFLPLSPLITTQDTYPGYGVNHYPLIVHLRNPEQILQRGKPITIDIPI